VQTIWKYELPIADVQKVPMPAAARLLFVGHRPGIEGLPVLSNPTLWALVDTDKPMVDRKLLMRGTGHEVPEPWEATYVGSAVCGLFVWHIFDGGE
jgi:hypothetical protein